VEDKEKKKTEAPHGTIHKEAGWDRETAGESARRGEDYAYGHGYGYGYGPGRYAYQQGPWVGGPGLFMPPGSVLNGLYNAALEGMIGTAEIMRGTLTNLAERNRYYVQQGMYPNGFADAVGATQDMAAGVATMFQRTWQSYADGVGIPPEPPPDVNQTKRPR
jgi:hypothetical protein